MGFSSTAAGCVHFSDEVTVEPCSGMNSAVSVNVPSDEVCTWDVVLSISATSFNFSDTGVDGATAIVLAGLSFPSSS